MLELMLWLNNPDPAKLNTYSTQLQLETYEPPPDIGKPRRTGGSGGC